jgi:hypothetical protein
MTTQKVEVGFDLAAGSGPFLKLDDAIQGQLDNADWVLAGTLFYDITSRVRGIEITRGKANYLGSNSAGEAIVELNNNDRAFDPEYASSPFYGNIIPKRDVRISSNGIVQYRGSIDDWNLQYQPGGLATASFTASDGFVYLANQTLSASTATVQSSGARVSAILNSADVDWPTAYRNIDTGVSTLGADVIAAGTNALSYLKLIEQTELGSVFIAKNGDFTFLDRTVAPVSSNLVEFSDDGTGIKYEELNVSYGSEDLANEIVISSIITGATAIAVDLDSQNTYGIFNYTANDLLMNTNTQVEALAIFLASKYSQPEYRFDTLSVRVNTQSEANQTKLLNMELGDVVKVTFTPSNIPPAIVKYAEVIRINQRAEPNGQHIISLGLSTIDYTYLVLNDAVFGKLDSGALGF